MTTPRQAPEAGRSEARTSEVVRREAALGAIVPGPTAAPDRETLGRVLDALRDLPEQPRPHRAAAPEPAVRVVPDVPLPRRRRLGRGVRPAD